MKFKKCEMKIKINKCPTLVQKKSGKEILKNSQYKSNINLDEKSSRQKSICNNIDSISSSFDLSLNEFEQKETYKKNLFKTFQKKEK